MLANCKVVNKLFYQASASFTRVRRAKTKKLIQYPVIPPWAKIHVKDPFDYKLRSKEELIKEQEENPPDFPLTLTHIAYPQATFENSDMSRGIKIGMDLNEMNLTKLQRKRMIKLIGPRYKGSSKFQITADMYANVEDNLAKGLEIARELYWEAKRAP